MTEPRRAADEEGRFPSVRQVEERVRRRQAQAPLPELAPGHLGGLAEALQARGIPIEVRAVRGKQTWLKVMLLVAEGDQGRLRDALAEIGALFSCGNEAGPRTTEPIVPEASPAPSMPTAASPAGSLPAAPRVTSRNFGQFFRDILAALWSVD